MPRTGILIADDELLIRIGIRHLIEGDEYAIIGEAENGEQVLSMLQTCKPDILLLDISMPVVDGLQVLFRIKQMKLPVKIVILSCHDDFELVRTALTNGASDYILKSSLDKENVMSSLKKVRDMLINEKKNMTQNLIDDHSLLDARLLRKNLLLDLIHNRQVPENSAELTGMEGCKIICAAFKIRKYRSIRKRYEDKDAFFITQSLFSVLEQSFTNDQRHELLEVAENSFALVCACQPGTIDRQIRTGMEQTVKNLIIIAKNYMNVELLFGIGGVREISLIHESYDEAVTAMEELFYSDRSPYAFYDPQKKKDGIEIHELEKQIKKLCIQRNYEYMAEKAEAYFKMLPEYPYTCSQSVKRFLMDITNLIFISENVDNHSVDEQIAEADSVESLHNIFKDSVITQYCNDIIGESNFITKNIIKYIRNNYMHPVQVGTIAKALGFSENHISRIFNKTMGTSIPEYLNKFRIEKAKELIRTTNYKLYCISEMVGFNSVAYFNTIFKNLEQCTPNEYRNKR